MEIEAFKQVKMLYMGVAIMSKEPLEQKLI
jgi:hypothetical protein